MLYFYTFYFFCQETNRLKYPIRLKNRFLFFYRKKAVSQILLTKI